MHLGTKIATADAVRADVIDTGICAGTNIMTLDGEMPVEHLTPGDRVITRDSGMAVVREIRVTKTKMQPIRIKAGSLGHTRPDRDMIAAPGMLVHIRDWRAEVLFGAQTALVPAHQLVDGEYLSKLSPREITTYQLIFDREHILYADGMEIASAKA